MTSPRKSRSTRIFEKGRLNADLFDALTNEYEAATGFSLVVCDPDGNLLQGAPDCDHFPCARSCRQGRERVLSESRSAGQPSIDLCHAGLALVGIPIVQDSKVVAGLIVAGINTADPTKGNAERLRVASDKLRELAVKYQLCGNLLGDRPDASRDDDADRIFFPINSLHFDRMRENCFRMEHALRDAINRHDDEAARKVVAAIAEELKRCESVRIDMIKGYATELVVVIGRAAMLGGTRAHLLLSVVFEGTQLVMHARTVDEVGQSISHTVNRVLVASSGQTVSTPATRLAKALTFMEKHLESDISREDVAKAAGLSPSQLSRLMREQTGRTFVDLLNQYRADRTAQLLLRTDLSLAEIAAVVGFSDQSYLSKIFRKYTGMTPSEYRHKSDAPKSD